MQISEINRQRIILVLITLSFFPLLFVLFTSTDVLPLVFKVSKFGAYTGVITLWWAYIFGIRRFMKFFIKDMTWAMKIHKWFNISGFLLFVIHPLSLIGLFQPIISPGSPGPYTIDVLVPRFEVGGAAVHANLTSLGVTAFYIWLVIWVTSALLKGKLHFRVWKLIHLMTYPILFMGLVHLDIGFLQGNYPLLVFTNDFLLFSYLVLIVWQILGRLGVLIPKYEIVKVDNVSEGSVSLRLHPLTAFPRPVRPEPGQYIYIQDSFGKDSHPFSISDYDPESHQIEITIKDLGPFSKKVQGYEVGKRLIVDGPYGVFLKEIDTESKNIVFLAGGVGITPFMSVIRVLDRIRQNDDNVWLFFGNKTFGDMMFKEELDKLAAENNWLNVVHVLDSQPDFEGEKGFITGDLLKKYLGEVSNYEYFMCGPPVMLTNVTKSLVQSGVSEDSIYSEKFSA